MGLKDRQLKDKHPFGISNLKFQTIIISQAINNGGIRPLISFEPFLKRFPPPMSPWPFPLVVHIPSYLFKNKEFQNFELLIG